MAKVSDLIDAGLINIGAKLTWKRRDRSNFSAEVQPDGKIKTDNGQVHKTPSGAARKLVGRPVDGWSVWRTSDGTTLSELRHKLKGI